jgi:hypothetical protein
MRQRREMVEHPFGTIKTRMGATQFLMKRLKRVRTDSVSASADRPVRASGGVRRRAGAGRKAPAPATGITYCARIFLTCVTASSTALSAG